MATAGRVKLAGRFPPGTRVRLIQVRDERVLRAQGGKLIATGKVGEDGVFEHAAEVGARYFLCGYVNGHPLEVRLTGRKADEVASEVVQPPVQPTRTRLASGQWSDEAPEQEKAPAATVAPGPAQHQAGDTVQRSATLHGAATPQDPSEKLPYPEQGDVDGPQMSSTEHGMATPIIGGPVKQEDVPDGLLQRSATPHGVTTPIHPGDAVQQQAEQDSALAKAARGAPGQAAALPLEERKAAPKKRPATRKPAQKRPATRKPAQKRPAARKPAAAKTTTAARSRTTTSKGKK